MAERYAIYLTPERDTPLWRFGTCWLGRDPETGDDTVERHGLENGLHARVTSAPARYGFHGTLKAPFRLANHAGLEDLKTALAAFTVARRSFELTQLRLGELNGFLALLADGNNNVLSTLAADSVRSLDEFRAPLSEAEIMRRNPDQLTLAQRKNLERWGYPYVFGEYRFHMTLTGKLAPKTLTTVRPVLEHAVDDLVHLPLRVSSVALFHEPAPSEPFHLIQRFGFGDAR